VCGSSNNQTFQILGGLVRQPFPLACKMNVFELGIVAAPISGLVAGIAAAKGHSAAVVFACATGGFLIGALAYLGPVLSSTFVWSRVRKPDAPPERPGAIEWVAGTTIVLLAALSPVVAWAVVSFAVRRLLG
jgi:hypothetical protein